MFRLISITLFFLLFVNLLADSPGKKLTDTDVNNLIVCIKSENNGIRSWGVFFAGKYKINKTVDHLIEILNNDKCVEIRKLAAYSLFQIGHEKGLTMLKKSAYSDVSPDIRKVCSSLYYASLSPVLN